MIKITGRALDGFCSIIANGEITFTNNNRDVMPVTVSTDGNGNFEATLGIEGKWTADKVITSETIEVE